MTTNAEIDLGRETSTVAIDWQGHLGRVSIRNTGARAVLDEVVVLSADHAFDPKSEVYGEGFQMLAQYSGNVTGVSALGPHDDWRHYRLPKPNALVTVWNLAIVREPAGKVHLYGFSSCRRYNGQIRIKDSTIEMVLLTEELVLETGESTELESVVMLEGTDEATLLELFAQSVADNHPPRQAKAPSGWCSWYAYGNALTTPDVIANAEAMVEKEIPLHYVQIDDGYQTRLGDWLSSRDPEVTTEQMFADIRSTGSEPAIWVAPFIAEVDSEVAHEHPDWFIQGSDGSPMRSDEVTFGGWRNGPWLMLDLTHAGALGYLRDVFSVMREQWGCRYFKLDATVWGAMPFGSRTQTGITSVEAYRAGMSVIRETVGEDSFILGCNAPLWPSLGLVDGMRVTDDLARDWETVDLVARSGFSRSWQHDRLWVNDPDCLTLHNTELSHLTQGELGYHAAYILAMGGSLFAGDALNEYSADDVERLTRFLPGCDGPAQFEKGSMIARAMRDGSELLFLFNRHQGTVEFETRGSLRDYWSDAPVKSRVIALDAHSARVFIADPGSEISASLV